MRLSDVRRYNIERCIQKSQLEQWTLRYKCDASWGDVTLGRPSKDIRMAGQSGGCVSLPVGVSLNFHSSSAGFGFPLASCEASYNVNNSPFFHLHKQASTTFQLTQTFNDTLLLQDTTDSALSLSYLQMEPLRHSSKWNYCCTAPEDCLAGPVQVLLVLLPGFQSTDFVC